MYARVPQQTKILGAAKLTGRARRVLVRRAERRRPRTRTRSIANGALRTRESVEPLANYSVVRARREFANQSTVGFMVTATSAPPGHVRPDFLPGQAFTGGLDWDWRMKKRYAIQGYWAGSDVRGNADAIELLQESTVHSFQRPDADHVELDPTRTSLRGARRLDRVQQDRRLEGALQLQRRLQDARGSTSTTSASCAAPTCGR